MFWNRQLSARKAFWGMILSFALSPLLFFLFIDCFLIGHTVEFSSKSRQFFLEEAKPPRVMVFSGSSSIYGMLAIELEEYFQIPAVNLGDVASVPMQHRIYNLIKFVKKGDVTIFPIEWQFYLANGNYDGFSKNYTISGTFKHYYTSLPLNERLKYVFDQLTITALGSGMGIWQPHAHFSFLRQRTKMIQKHFKFLRKDRGNLRQKTSGSKEDIAVERPDCSEWVLREQYRLGYQLSKRFLENLTLLEEVKKKGAKVIFTFPVVVSGTADICYAKSQRKKVMVYADLVKKEIESRGFVMVGSPFDYEFGKDYYYNSPYHVIEEAGLKRTKTFLQRLKEKGIGPLTIGRIDTTKRTMKEALEEIETRMLAK